MPKQSKSAADEEESSKPLKSNSHSRCIHGKEIGFCGECGGSGLRAVHGKRKYQCKDCGDSAYCEHGKRKDICIDCGGASICVHGKNKYICKDCRGSATCPHTSNKNRCKICTPPCSRHNAQKCFDCLLLDTNVRQKRSRIG
jgi:hypothetical protein